MVVRTKARQKCSQVGKECMLRSACWDERYTVIQCIIQSVDSIIESVVMESVDSICRDSADTQYMPIQTNFSKSPKHLTYKPL